MVSLPPSCSFISWRYTTLLHVWQKKKSFPFFYSELAFEINVPPDTAVSPNAISAASEEIISFHEVDIVTPSQKLLARKLSCNVVQGKGLLLTGIQSLCRQCFFNLLLSSELILSPFFVLLKVPMVVERVLFLECSGICGPPSLGELPNPQKGCFMFLSGHIPAWVLCGIRSYTLSQWRKRR